ncbi:amidase [Bosea sp. (in: a-proteobacteria)]|uniref:amidase n=1 Tax=Bosea sp. (in: a-proteobacteria) TaxID=1871050 RepID=UPI0031FF3055
MEACLARIAAREPEVRAWSYLDPASALDQAREADRRQAAGQPLGPLHGLPIGVKDVFDTVDMPSEYGSALYRGRRPQVDAAAVARLRRAGAIIIGKTTTSEFGMYHPSPTRNPRDLARSPGVSSAGSAAAVVDHMVPLALGTQHTASTTLPASFCGAFAFKPSLGFADMAGSNILVPRLAHLGLMARSVADLALFAGAFDSTLADLDSIERLPAPRVALVRGPGWASVAPDAAAALDRLLARLAVPVAEPPLPTEFERALEVTLGLLDAHLAFRFGALPTEDFERLCPPLRAGVDSGRAMSAPRYLELDALADRLTMLAAGLFAEHDLLVTLSTPGEATLLAEGPGSGVMSMPWSLCGLPTVSLPLLHGVGGLPIGLQLIGPQGGDRALLQAAAWLAAQVNPTTSHEI